MEALLTKEEKLLKRTINEFAVREVRPCAVENDKKPDDHRKIMEREMEIAFRELNLNTLFVPEEYGGSGFGIREEVLIMEELAWGDLGFALMIMNHTHSVPPIVLRGTSEQKSKWLPAVAGVNSPGIMISAALTEPGTGASFFSEDPSCGIKTSAIKDGSDYILNGQKCFINNIGLSSLYLVWARTNSDISSAAGGTSVFLVPADTPGLKIGRRENFMGIRTSCQGDLILEDCRVPAENILGGEGMGFQVALDTVPGTSTLMGSAAVGLARAAFEIARDYAAQRSVEKNPVISNQAVSHRLVDMDMQITASRALVWESAIFIDQKGPDFKFPIMAKVFASDMAQQVSNEAMQITGVYGYSKELPIEKIFRDSKALLVSGPNIVMRNHLSMFLM